MIPKLTMLSCQDMCWTKPPPGWCKLNFDAGFLESKNLASWGAILRDDGGNVLLSAWGCLEHCPNAEMAEALAGNMSIKAIIPFCINPVIVENDCAAVIKALQKKEPDKSIIAAVVRDMHDLLSLVPDYKFSNVKRANNTVAHELAKLGYSLDGCVMVQSAPPCVAGLIESDCNRNLLV